MKIFSNIRDINKLSYLKIIRFGLNSEFGKSNLARLLNQYLKSVSGEEGNFDNESFTFKALEKIKIVRKK